MSQEYDSVELVGDDAVRNLAFASLLAALTAAFAQVSIPLPGLPAPISFQVFGVYFAGLLLGPRWGGLSMALYLLVGAAGAPVFSNATGGLQVILGPTGGYLISYVFAAILIGIIVHRSMDQKPLAEVSVTVQAVALFAGLALIYALGVPWLAANTAYDLEGAVRVGMLIFLPGDLLKIVATIGLIRSGELAVRESAAGV